MPTKTELKHDAQDILMAAMQAAFDNVPEEDALYSVMSAQMARVEKLFGYDEYSFTRGV